MTLYINAKYVLLTYAQCGDLDPFAIVNHLATLQAECIVGREQHLAGGHHLHAFVSFGRKFRSRVAGVFDVDGFHPNIVTSRGTPEKGWDYATKDGDVVAGALERPNPDGDRDAESRWRQLGDAETEDEFWELAKQLAPRELITAHTQFRAYARHKFRAQPEAYSGPREISINTQTLPELDQWATSNMGTSGRSVILDSEPAALTGIWSDAALSYDSVWDTGSESGGHRPPSSPFLANWYTDHDLCVCGDLHDWARHSGEDQWVHISTSAACTRMQRQYGLLK